MWDIWGNGNSPHKNPRNHQICAGSDYYINIKEPKI